MGQYFKSQLPQQTHATRCVMSIVLYTKIDAHFHKMATVVGRTKLTTCLRRSMCPGEIILLSPVFATKFQKEASIFLTDFPYIIVQISRG